MCLIQLVKRICNITYSWSPILFIGICMCPVLCRERKVGRPHSQGIGHLLRLADPCARIGQIRMSYSRGIYQLPPNTSHLSLCWWGAWLWQPLCPEMCITHLCFVKEQTKWEGGERWGQGGEAQLWAPQPTEDNTHYDDVIKWKRFPRYWPFVRGIHRSPVNSPHKGQWRGALMFSLICYLINGWANNRKAGDLRRYRAHYEVTIIGKTSIYGRGHKCAPVCSSGKAVSWGGKWSVRIPA